ncbi:phosphatidate cytidylyltransferase [Rheinheimera baltica]|uniref:Phosphatidate cytidylyltransferase n=1 Tax=Rheinheimera baltica TaxID=67576 RepID=A0ABT9HYN2_9GAMM|nr:phosphatidate cytidylyltransferase [Rheinheimera baltica]MDP5135915.1 phosphatidate cytidylyltransferase [Rheinheimera baltica]MDP5141754.1 phosphatidate cytidylyltransferase [Rheinheimera baltica]MDP5150265.1 phosphatidate cytidylyltransferase [Rheinheimera baltica]
MFKQRVITALILAPLALLAVFYLPLAGFALFISGAFLLGAWEWSGLCSLANNAMRAVYVGVTAVIFGVLYWQLPAQVLWPLEHNVLLSSLLLAGVCWWILAVVLVLTYPRSQTFWAKSDWGKALMGWLTLIPAWAAILFIRSTDYTSSTFTGAWLIFCLLALVWAADIGGYIVGKPFGKRKLLPRVSPGKTVEGMLGGLVLVAVVVTVVAKLQGWPAQLWVWYVSAFFLTILSVFGDLTESMFKRVAGKKDSGAFLPGHGGILDRIDSLTATAPLFAIIVAVFGGFY